MNTKGSFVPLIDFNVVVDTDYGLLSTIGREYLDTRVFSIDWFNKHQSIRSKVQELYLREHQNPLTLISHDTSLEDLDSLYKEFISDKDIYKKILDSSVTTEMFNVVELFSEQSDIDTTILCYNEDEIEYLDRFDETKNVRKILLFDSDKAVKEAQQIYFKNLDDDNLISICENTWCQTIYIASYRYNLAESKEMYNERQMYVISELSNNRCPINSIDIYDKNKLFPEEET